MRKQIVYRSRSVITSEGVMLNQLSRILAGPGQCKDKHGSPKVKVKLGRVESLVKFGQGEGLSLT